MVMSRRCPKRNHLFLNWLKANRSDFLVEPQVLRFRKNHIDLTFKGLTSAIRIEYYCYLAPQSSSWISIDVMWQGNKWDGLADFCGAELCTENGWMSLCEPPENRRYWHSREELWIELCFEEFLNWCNKNFANNSWLALYDYGNGAGEAKLQKDNKPIWDPVWLGKLEKDFTQKVILMIPVFKTGHTDL
jgi:hypothetical protein